jgi:hypothetical protein
MCVCGMCMCVQVCASECVFMCVHSCMCVCMCVCVCVCIGQMLTLAAVLVIFCFLDKS